MEGVTCLLKLETVLRYNVNTMVMQRKTPVVPAVTSSQACHSTRQPNVMLSQQGMCVGKVMKIKYQNEIILVTGSMCTHCECFRELRNDLVILASGMSWDGMDHWLRNVPALLAC